MATISGILEGKTGNYLKLDDLGEDSFLILESIDPRKTEIRSERVPNKEGSRNKETEYFHILGRLGDVEKDLSMTFTALKQLAEVMPRDDNWKGYSIKYMGTKGQGKLIKYHYQVTGKLEGSQGRLPAEPEPAPQQGNLNDMVKIAVHSMKVYNEHFGGVADNAIMSTVHGALKRNNLNPTMPVVDDVVRLMKSQGFIIQDDKTGTWRVTT